MKTLCPCGRPLHYADAEIEAQVRRLCEVLGNDVLITTTEGTWRVPRHYIALHGLHAAELPALGFPRTDN